MKFEYIKNVFTIGIFSAFSRVMGFVRDWLFATIMGVSSHMDIFFIVLQLPNAFRVLFAEGALQTSLIPLFKDYTSTKLRMVFGGIALFVFFITLLITIFVEIFMPQIIYILAYGYRDNPTLLHIGIVNGRIMFPFLILISISTVWYSMLNTQKWFMWTGSSLLFFNILLIITLIIFWWMKPDLFTRFFALSWVILIVGIVQFFWGIWGIWKLGILPAMPKFFQWLGPFFKLFVPSFASGLLSQSNTYVASIMATIVASGGVSYLYYANRLYLFPVGLFGYALMTVLVPHFVGKTKKELVTQFQHTVLFTLFWAFPMSMALLVIPKDIAVTLFAYGKMQFSEAQVVGGLVRIFAFGLSAVLLSRTLTALLYAQKKMILNFFINFFGTGQTILLIVWLSRIYGLQSIVWAMVYGNLFILCAQWISLWYMKYVVIDKQMIVTLGKILISTLIMGGALYTLHHSVMMNQNTGFIGRIGILSVEIVAGMLTYFVVYFLLMPYARKQIIVKKLMNAIT